MKVKAIDLIVNNALEEQKQYKDKAQNLNARLYHFKAFKIYLDIIELLEKEANYETN